MSKYAVRAFGEAIAAELAPRGVTVTIISPGFVASDIRRTSNDGTFHADAPDSVPTWLQMPTDRACRKMLAAVARGKPELILTAHGHALVWMERFTPWLVRRVARVMAKRELVRKPKYTEGR